jgi:magnesium transporter
MPPGSLVPLDKELTDTVSIQVIRYNDEHWEEETLASIADLPPLDPAMKVTWINVTGLSDIGLIQQIGARFKVHPLILEDILHTRQRPKFEEFDAYLFMVMKLITCREVDAEIEAEQVSVIFGERYLITFLESADAVFEPVRDRIRKDGRIRTHPSDYLAYALIDLIVDNYFVVLENLGEKIEFLEDDLLTRPDPATLSAIHQLKKDMIFMRRSVWPLREVISSLERSDSPLIHQETILYIRDVYDHTVQMIDAIESFRDIIAGMIDIYLSSVSFRLNQIMKFLTLIATIFIPLTFLVGVYGMNFQYMPELSLPWGYPVLWGVMIVIASGMLVYFSRRGWL